MEAMSRNGEGGEFGEDAVMEEDLEEERNEEPPSSEGVGREESAEQDEGVGREESAEQDEGAGREESEEQDEEVGREEREESEEQEEWQELHEPQLELGVSGCEHGVMYSILYSTADVCLSILT